MLEYSKYLTPKLIWNIEQNKPSLIAKDLEPFGVKKEIVHNVLLARGVYKWLAVRRRLIKLKETWKAKITETQHKITNEKNSHKKFYLKGYLKAYEECRKEVRELCHSDRWQAPDFDRQANEHLKKLEQLQQITYNC